MKTIVCYGDSNTHGYDPETGGRYDYTQRWTKRLQQLLGSAYDVVEEGLNSRTTVLHDPCYDDEKSGIALLPAIIKTHMPIDLLILMLGTNDLKQRFHMEAADIARAVARLVATAKIVSASKHPDGIACPILLVAPPRVTKDLWHSANCAEFGARAIRISSELSDGYAQVARAQAVAFLDAARVTAPSAIDGLHLAPEGHDALAQAIARLCVQLLEPS